MTLTCVWVKLILVWARALKLKISASIYLSRLFVFHDQEALDRFMDAGISVGGQVDTAAKAGDSGAEVGGEPMVANVTVPDNPVRPSATGHGKRNMLHWRNSELNRI